MTERKEMDDFVITSLGIRDYPLDELYNEFVHLVEDRLIKADRNLKSQEELDEQDN